MQKQIDTQMSKFWANRKLVKGFTLTELLVAVGLLAAVLSASTIIFHYTIEAQRNAMATAEIMRSLRAITDQLNLNLGGLRKDGYLILYSNTVGGDPNNHRDALYFFSEGDFQSTSQDDLRSNIARIYFGHADGNSNNLLLDMKLLVPGYTKSPVAGDDYSRESFVECQADISKLEKQDPNNILDYSGSRPVFDANNPVNLLAQRVSNLLIEWTYKSDKWLDSTPTTIEWYGLELTRNSLKSNDFERPGYRAIWTPRNQDVWPDAIRFEFTLYDSRGVVKDGKRFEHIVYIGR